MIKKFNKTVFLSLIGAVLISSCTKKSSTTPAANTTTNTTSTQGLSADIGGTKWVADTLYSTNHSPGSPGVGITAWKKSDSSQFAIHLPTSVVPGTYNIDGNAYNLTYNKNTNTYYVASSGTVTISSYANSIISGTFQGTYANFKNPSDKVTITSGAFTADVK